MANVKKTTAKNSAAKTTAKAQADLSAKKGKPAQKLAKSAKGTEKKPVKKGPQKKPNIFKRFIAYIRNVRLEIKRTTWPTRNEVLNMTIIVIVALLFFGILIFVVDQIMVAVVGFISQFNVGSSAATASDAAGVEGVNINALLTHVLSMGGK